MTAEHLLVFELNDVRGVRVECTKCHSTLTVRLNQTVTIPYACPNCTLGGTLNSRERSLQSDT